MSHLYNCRHDGDQYRITKFDHEMNVESSYLCDSENCECPAGVRPTCRHRQMLPKFIQRGAVSTGWMLDWDRGGWVDNRTQDELDESAAKYDRDEYLEGITQRIGSPLPKGVQAFSLGDPDSILNLHNAIADAVGEPEAKLEPNSTVVSASAFDAEDEGSNPSGVATDPLYDSRNPNHNPTWRRF